MKKEKLINIIKLFTTFTIFFFRNIIKYLLIILTTKKGVKLSPTKDFVLSIITYIIMIIMFILIYRKELSREWKNFSKGKLKNMDIAFKYYFFGILGMVVTNIILNFILKMGNSQNEQLVQEMIKLSPIIMLISAGILGPITEELVFRTSFKTAIEKKWTFVTISALIFGSLHVIGYELKTPLEILYIIPYASLGASFALMDYETDSTFPSIIMHMCHNTVLTLISILPTII